MSPTIESTARLCGAWLAAKLRTQARQQGTYRAALNARKQGVPIDLAAAILSRRDCRSEYAANAALDAVPALHAEVARILGGTK